MFLLHSYILSRTMKKERLLLTARHLQFNRNDSLEKQLNNLELSLVIDYFKSFANPAGKVRSMLPSSEPPIASGRFYFALLLTQTKAFLCTNWYEKRNVRINPLTVFKLPLTETQNKLTSLAIVLVAIFVERYLFVYNQCKIYVVTKIDDCQKSN